MIDYDKKQLYDNSKIVDEMLDEAEQEYQEGMYISADAVLDLLRSEESF